MQKLNWQLEMSHSSNQRSGITMEYLSMALRQVTLLPPVSPLEAIYYL